MTMSCGLTVFATVGCLTLCHGAAAQSSPASESNVYYTEDGIKAPKLAPTDFSPVISNSCEYEGAGIVRISLVVNPQGRSEKVAPLYRFDDDIDKAAVSIAEVDRFSPGTKDGVPVPVAQELEIKLTVCRVKIADKDGTVSARLRLKSTPVQKLLAAPKQPLPGLLPTLSSVPVTVTPQLSKQLGKMKSDITPPVPLETPVAEWPPDLRNVEGVCLVRLVVDAQGQPQALRIQQGTNEQFNEKALEAVEKYRFTPAKKGQDLVAYKMSVVVHFKLH